jgi:hypothetical protein
VKRSLQGAFTFDNCEGNCRWTRTESEPWRSALLQAFGHSAKKVRDYLCRFVLNKIGARY